MSSTETISESVAPLPEPPRLLVEWSSPWQEFKSAVGPALTRSPKRLAGEAPTGLVPYRGFFATLALEALLLWVTIVLSAHLEALRPHVPPALPKYDVLYYYGDELPQTRDNGGAQSGKSGNAGGQEARHRTQTIRVVRGDKPAEKVVDAPRLNLPRSESVANLLAFKPLPGPPPAEGLRSSLVAPALPATNVVPPSPELKSSLSHNQNSLTTNIIAPAPDISHTATRKAPELSTSLVAPAPDVARDKMRSALPMNPSVIAPASSETARDLASSRVPLTQTTSVIVPPVSAPQRDIASVPKLSLPAPVVVAPPPSQVGRDLNSWGGTAIGDVRPNPVPPPPTPAGNSGSTSRGRVGDFAPQVVPPPVNAEGTGLQGNGAGRSAGTLLGSAEVVPPPPGLGGGKALSGSGRGTKGTGTGGPLDLGTVVGPPSSGGNTAGTGVVVSSQPGTKVGVPTSGSGGSIAMSPTGTAKTGLGGNGGGTGIGKGNGPGSGMQGEGPGAGKEGAGRGSDPKANAGISPYPGPGGAGRGNNGTPALPGVSVQGGNTITLPSFGSPSGDASSGPGRSSANDHKRSGVTIVATSRSGGVFNRYGQLSGDNYSIYIETSLGTAVMQYADTASAAHPSREALTEPEPLRKDLPEGLHSTRIVIACILDRSGVLKDLKVLEAGTAESTSKILAALPNWKFRPAFRGNEPVEVNAIIGFGIDTR